MSFHTWQNISNSKPHTVFKDMDISYKGKTKFLGLYLTDDIKWKVHIEHLSKILNRNYYVIKSLKDITIINILGSTCFYSHFRCGILFLGGDTQSTKTSKLQKKAVRLIGNVKNNTSHRELFRALNILPIPSVYVLEIVCYIKVNMRGLKQNLDGHDHNTRHRSDFQTQFCRTDIFKRSVNNVGVKLYNKLPNYLKNLENVRVLRKQLKAFFLQQTFYSVDKYLS
jgi:hypothetical protein